MWVRVRVVLHRAENVAFRVCEVEELADAVDVERLGDNPPAGSFDGRLHLGDVLDRYGRLEPPHLPAWLEFAAAVQGDDGLALARRRLLVVVGRAPGLEAPAEHRLVEGLGALDIVGVEREMADRQRHRSGSLLVVGAQCGVRACVTRTISRQLMSRTRQAAEAAAPAPCDDPAPWVPSLNQQERSGRLEC